MTTKDGRHFTNEWASIYFEDGICYGEYKDVNVDLAKAREITEARKQVHQGEEAVLVVDVTGIKSVNKEARTYFSKHGSENLRATAIITGSEFTSVMGNFFMRVNFKRPPIPTRLFKDRESATDWARQFL